MTTGRKYRRTPTRAAGGAGICPNCSRSIGLRPSSWIIRGERGMVLATHNCPHGSKCDGTCEACTKEREALDAQEVTDEQLR